MVDQLDTPDDLPAKTSKEPLVRDKQDFLNFVNAAQAKAKKTSMLLSGNEEVFLLQQRFSSGSLALDIALGGGWPFGKMVLNVGTWSTGKTYLALKAIQSLESYDHLTKKHITQLTEAEREKFTPCSALWISFDPFDGSRAKEFGISLEGLTVFCPETVNEGIDIVTNSLYDNVFDLIVIDTISGANSAKDMEKSAEDNLLAGSNARLFNDAFRKWQANLTSAPRRTGFPCGTIWSNNHFRDKFTLFGDPRTFPGGRGQSDFASVIVYLNTIKYSDEEKDDQAIAKISGLTYKNKTYLPKKNFEFSFRLFDGETSPAGEINNFDALFTYAKDYRLIISEGGKVTFRDKEFKTQKQVKEYIQSDPVVYAALWQDILKASRR